MSDWGSDGEEGPDLSNLALDLPDVEIKSAIPEAVATAPPPAVNAWAKRSESNDVRNLQRGNQRSLQEPRSAPAPARGVSSGGGGGGFGGRNDSARGVKLYVTGLPQETTENQLQDFFADCGRVDVRLLYHNDSGNIKAAIITMEAGVEAERGLAKDRTRFYGRSLFVKIDGAGRRDRGGYNHPDGGYRGGGGGGGGGYGNGRSRDDRRSGYGFNSDGNRDRDRDRSMPHDPTIPSGDVPTGRKKLVLKPRSKPMPKLDIDHRAIGGGAGAAATQAEQKKTWERKGASSSNFSGSDKRVPGGDRSIRNGGPDRNRRNASAAGPGAPAASVPENSANPPEISTPPAENGKKHGKKANAEDAEWSSVKGSGSATPAQKPEYKKSTLASGRPGAGDNKQSAAPTLKNAFDVLGEADE